MHLFQVRLLQVRACTRQVELYQQWPRKQLRPVLQHLLGAPLLRPRAVDVQHHVVVVAHHRIGRHINGKDVRQLFDAGGNPAPAVLEVLAAVVVVPAQKGAAYAARDAVVPGGVGEADDGGAGTSRGGGRLKGGWAGVN